MNWTKNVDEFLKEFKISPSFYQYIYHTLEFDKKNEADRWKSLSQNLKEWNNKYLIQYESISLCSPIMWNLNICISKFNILEDTSDIRNWLYWVFFSSYMNYCVSYWLITRENKNKQNPQQYYLKTRENIGDTVEIFLNHFFLEDLLKEKHVWIDKRTFLEELISKKEKSFKRLQKENAKNSFPMYAKYKEYEELFQSADEIDIAEINPQGMKDLFDDCMCYLVKIKNQVYTLYFEDYA